jgi:predicted unusual protein kinase regulating ubiquinone biosynthesis (AarF/ABC1/UbiB family)
MALSLQPQHLQRYRDIARLFLKYGRGDLLQNSGIDDLPPDDPPATTGLATATATATEVETKGDRAAMLADDLEKLGPTFVKIGQFLSTRADLLPADYIAALARLQDHVEPFPFAEVERIVQEELGARLSKAFTLFEDIPLAAASLGQVHRAELRNGMQVAVKVQRPDIRDTVLKDLEAIGEIADFMDGHTDLGKRQHFADLFDQFRKSLLKELDYRLEARNLTMLADQMSELDRILVPRPVEDYVTSRVLTMEFVHGRKITSLSPLAKLEIDGAPLAEELCRAYLRQILVDGFFHADPHPGNVLLTDDGRIALIDLGMVGQMAPAMQEDLLKLVLAVSEGRGDDAADAVIKIGTPLPDADPGRLRRRVAEMVLAFQGLRMKEIALGRFLFDAAHEASDAGYRMPRELAMLSKTLLNVDEVSRQLDPEFDPNASIRENASGIMRDRMAKNLSPGRMFAGLLEAKEFAEKLPRRLNQVIDAISENRVRIKVDTINEVLLMEGLQKIANRITLGLILASLIVGAAMLMRIETRFRILGYPGLAMLFFMAAAVTGLGLAANILLSDMRARKDKVVAAQRQRERADGGAD